MDEQTRRLMQDGGAERADTSYDWGASGYEQAPLSHQAGVGDPSLVGLAPRDLPGMSDEVETADEDDWKFPEHGSLTGGTWERKAEELWTPDMIRQEPLDLQGHEAGTLIQVDGKWVPLIDDEPVAKRSDDHGQVDDEPREPVDTAQHGASTRTRRWTAEDIERAVYSAMRDGGAPISVAEDMTATVMAKLGA